MIRTCKRIQQNNTTNLFEGSWSVESMKYIIDAVVGKLAFYRKLYGVPQITLKLHVTKIRKANFPLI